MKEVVEYVSFRQKQTSLEGVQVLIVCHSVNNRAIPNTDVTDTFPYDNFLKKACAKLGESWELDS